MDNSSGKYKVWQIGGGSTGRSCAKVFLKYGVGLIGPGDPGPWKGNYRKDRSTRHIRQFADEAKKGDIIILRQGRSKILAVGIIASDYQYLDQFEDVDGWDLQHARRVRWFALSEPYDFKAPIFGATPGRFSGVAKSAVIDFARSIIASPPSDWQTAKLPGLPEQEEDLDMAPPGVMSVIASAKDIVPLYWTPSKFGELPTEDELVAHFTIPLLKLLGWPSELIAIKWRYVDISLFNSLPRCPENCSFIIEAKRFDTGFGAALKQARGYLKALGISRNVLITDGIRYRLYAHEKGFAPVAYANLARPKKSASVLFENIKKV